MSLFNSYRSTTARCVRCTYHYLFVGLVDTYGTCQGFWINVEKLINIKKIYFCGTCWHIWHVPRIFIHRHQLTPCLEFCYGKDWRNLISHALLDVFAVDNDMKWMTRSIDSGRIRINIRRQCNWHTWLHSCGGDGIRALDIYFSSPASYFSFHEDNISFSQTYMPITNIIYEGLRKDKYNVLLGVELRRSF